MGLDWESLDFDCEIMISYFTIKWADKKKFNDRNSVLGFWDFPSQQISGQSEKRYGMQNCSREQRLAVVFCGPFSANYARACKTAVGYL